MTSFRGMRSGLAATTAIYAMAVASPALAQSKSFNVPAQSAMTGIPELARQADVQILVAESAARGKAIKAVKGTMTIDQALRRALAGTGLRVSSSDGRTFTLVGNGRADPAPQDTATALVGDADIVVTGSRIAGAKIASPVIRLSEQDIRQAGFNDAGEAVRSIPQNFTGGQNPGVVLGQTGGNVNNQNLTGASSLNLRGLGPDATLTLINGRRISYDSSIQAVDISVIPIDAISEIQIVPDGASAIYGSDAVGGVGNVILKKDFNGLTTRLRIGGTDEGGDAQRQASVVAGANWKSGGFLAAYDYSYNSPVTAGNRSDLAYLPSVDTILPGQTHHSGLVTVHQDLGLAVTLGLDAFYSRRKMSYVNVQATSRQETSVSAESYTIAPNVTVRLGANWAAELSGVYSEDKSTTSPLVIALPSEQPRTLTTLCYCNTAKAAELGLKGTVLDLPGGAVKTAFGGGYRENTLVQPQTTYTYATGASVFVPNRISNGARKSYYGYAEISVPIVGPEQDIAWLRRLELTGAVRYEDYNDLGGVGTPKIGIIYSPSRDFDIRASWGKSFKAPTLLQQLQTQTAFLYGAATLGRTGGPATALAILRSGGNPNLAPEKATTWTATLAWHPQFVPGLRVELSYFDIDYRNRIVNPIMVATSALSNPAYADFITSNPTPAQQQAFIAGAPVGLQNVSGQTYNPANVVALVDSLFANAARQTARGVDGTIDYRFSVDGISFKFGLNGSYLESQQQNTSTSPILDLAGIVYNPPNFRSRLSLVATKPTFTVGVFANYIGPLDDNRATPLVGGEPMTTFDATFSLRPKFAQRFAKDFEIALNISNLTNQSPPYLRNQNNFVINYDSLSYSGLGRTISFSIRTGW